MKKAIFLFAILFGTINCIAQQNVSKIFLLGKVNYAADTSFIKVQAIYTNKPTYLKKATYSAFLKMRAAAAKDGVKLYIVSGTRSFADQSRIWNKKWDSLSRITPKLTPKEKVLDILRWSSMPGTSRHHWGTDMDLDSTTPDYFNKPAGEKVYAWLMANGSKYGFYQPFTAGRATGYKEEKWHWSYLPLSKTYLTEYVKQITYPDLVGVKGGEVAGDIGIIKNWVLGVNPQCK